MPLYRLENELPALEGAVLVASFDGWVDAAEAASSAVAHLARDARLVATFDPDAVFDYRSRRPVLDVQDGRLTDLRWPELTLRHTRIQGRDLSGQVVISGPGCELVDAHRHTHPKGVHAARAVRPAGVLSDGALGVSKL